MPLGSRKGLSRPEKNSGLKVFKTMVEKKRSFDSERFNSSRKKKRLSQFYKRLLGNSKTIIDLFPRKLNYVSILFFVMLSFCIWLFFISDSFNIKEVEIKTNISKVEEYERLKGVFEPILYNRNLISISPMQLENSIRSELPDLVEDIRIRKIYPSKLEINVELSNIMLAVITTEGYAILKQDFNILGSDNKFREITTKLNFTDTEKKYLDSKIDIDSVEVKEIYLSSLSEDQILTFDWQKVALEEKLQILDSIENSIQSKLKAHFDFYHDYIKETYQEDFPIIEVVYAGLNKEAITSKKLLKDTFDLQNNIKSKGADIKNIKIVSDIKVEIYLLDGKVLIFGEIGENSIEDQFKVFDAIYGLNDYNGLRIIDFRSGVISGKK